MTIEDLKKENVKELPSRDNNNSIFNYYENVFYIFEEKVS